MTSAKALWAFALFSACIFLLGGGGRADILSVGPLRAIAAVFLALAIFYQTKASWRNVAVPVVFLALLALWMALQLIPLPVSWWSSLPGRSVIRELDEAIGIAGTWRPITLSTMKTANSLASLVVPLATLMIVSLFDEKAWQRSLWIVIITGVASTLLGVAQVTLRGSPGLYLYEITNPGSAVGLFSNKNHNGIFLAIALLFALFRTERIKWPDLTPADVFTLLAVIVLVSGMALNGSRTAFGCLVIVGLVTAVRTFAARSSAAAQSAGRLRYFVGIAMGTVAVALLGVFTILGRNEAVSSLFADDVGQDLRFTTFPYVTMLARDYQPFGAGFGAFEHAYQMVEPTALMTSRYFNQAHDDWLQLPIEGGLPAIVILVLFLVAVSLRLRIIAKREGDSRVARDNAWLGAATLLIFAGASVFDYPLRTPSLMLVAAMATAMLFRKTAANRPALLVEAGGNSRKAR